MIFIVLTFIAALAIEGLGTLVSVIGLSALFGSNPIIIALVVALDLGKIMSVSLLYTHWRDLPKLMKGYALIASFALMTITSAGAAGYLSAEFQKAIVGTQEGSLKVDVLKQQQAKYEERKKQIDAQIAALPEKTTVNQRLRLMRGFQQEQKDLQDKIAQIDKDLPALQVTQIGAEAHAGPILYIAKAFDVPVEVAVKWVILLIIFVFDPLAIFLIIAGNFLLAKRRTGEVYGDIVHHDEDEPPEDLRVVPASKAYYTGAYDDWSPTKEEFDANVEANRPFYEEMKASVQPTYDPTLPLELDVDKFLEATHSEPKDLPVRTPPPAKPPEPDESWWQEQEARARQYTVDRAAQFEREMAEQAAEDRAQADIKSGISSMAIEEGDALPSAELPEAPPEPEQVEEVPEPIVEPPEEVPSAPVKEPTRETITLSSLGLAPTEPLHHVTAFGGIQPDPHTVVDASQIDQVTPLKTDQYPRLTKKRPTT